jgi:uncharacterized protein (DUF4415 family)
MLIDSAASVCLLAGLLWSATPRVARFATFSACERLMNVSKPVSRRTLGSDLARVDGHLVKPSEYKELPEFTDDMLARAVVKKGGRPRLPPEVIARWRATGPGWQSRMAERLAKTPVPRREE